MLVGHGEKRLSQVDSVASLLSLERRLSPAGIGVPRMVPTDWPWRDWEPVLAPWIADASRVLALALHSAGALIGFRAIEIDVVAPVDVRQRIASSVEAELISLPALSGQPFKVAAPPGGLTTVSLGAGSLLLDRKYFIHDCTGGLLVD